MSIDKTVMTETEEFQELTETIQKMVMGGRPNLRKIRHLANELSLYEWPEDKKEERIIRDAIAAASDRARDPELEGYPLEIKASNDASLKRFLNKYTGR